MKQSLSKFYNQYKKKVVFISLILVIIAAQIPIPYSKQFAFAAGFAVCVVILEVLFSIESYISHEEEHGDFFVNIDGVMPLIKKAVIKNKHRNRISIKVLSITFSKTWEPIKRSILLNKDVKNISLEFCTLEANYSKKFDSTWPKLIEITSEQVDDYVNQNFEELNKRNIIIKKYHYKHTPTIHGFLINDEELFLGFSWWLNNDQLATAEKPYIYVTEKTEIGRFYIALFKNWFSHVVAVE